MLLLCVSVNAVRASDVMPGAFLCPRKCVGKQTANAPQSTPQVYPAALPPLYPVSYRDAPPGRRVGTMRGKMRREGVQAAESGTRVFKL